MSPEELIVLVKWNADDLAFEVVDERTFVLYMTTDTGSFYPYVKRSLCVIEGAKFDGYKWFTTNVDAIAADKDRSVANYLTEAANSFSNYNFDARESIDDEDQYDVFCFMAAGALHPSVLRTAEIKGYDLVCPFASAAHSAAMADFLAVGKASPPEMVHAEASPCDTTPQGALPRPLWLL